MNGIGRVDGLTDGEQALVERLLSQIEKRGRRNRLRSAYYDMRHVVRQVGVTIPPQYEQLGLVLGWAGKAVDGLGRRCNLDNMVWADGDLDSLGWRELRDSNFLFSEFAQARTDSLIHGVSYLVTTRGVEGEPRALVHARSALDATGDWDVRARRLKNFLSITGSDENGRITGFILYVFNETVSAVLADGKWAVERSKHTFGVPVDALIYRPRTSRRMGRSRINRAVMQIQDGAVRSLTRAEAHMDIYAIPKLILLGADKSIFGDDDWLATMGRVLGLPDDEDAANPRAEIQSIDASSPAPHNTSLNTWAKLMARETDLPDSDFALSDMAVPTSAESYTASRENLIAEAEGATDDWSPAHRSTVRRALAIQGGLSEVPAEWASIDSVWRSPIYLSRSAVADAGAKQLAVAPEWLRDTRIGLKLLGLSDQQIDLAYQERRLNQGRLIVEAVANGRLAVEGGVGDGDRGGGVGVAGGVSAVEVN